MIKKLEEAKGLSKYIINVIYTYNLYYILILKLWNLCLVFLLCYVFIMVKYVIDEMLRYMLLRCAMEMVSCILVDEDMCHVN